MATLAQKRTLAALVEDPGAPVNPRTLEVLERRGYVKREGNLLAVTVKGRKLLAGKLGNSSPVVDVRKLRSMSARGTRKAPKAKRDRRQAAAAKREAMNDLEAHYRAEEKARGKAFGRILGPSGKAHAVKVARADGGAFTRSDVQAFEKAGWKVLAAASVAARPGASGIPGVVLRDDDWIFSNPATLGPSGLARALVLAGPINRRTVEDLAAAGFDVMPAPKKIREGATVRNPAPNLAKKVYAAMVKAADKGQALNAEDLARRIKAEPGAVERALETLKAQGLAWIMGHDLFGPCWMPGQEPQRGLFANPGKPTKAAASRKAMKKAAAWYWDENELDEPRELVGYKPPTSGVLVGEIVAIEYRSRKDGTSKVYRHDVTKKRDLILSTDGSTFIINPPFKITKRGIEG